ncbi:hypothetical protein TNCV_1581911 [Trichonephila clavipes]|nr:hypothetical protein TNCV_1581911 [Trichonephila clavipes]
MTDLKEDQGDWRTTGTNKHKRNVGSKKSSRQISRTKKSRIETIQRTDEGLRRTSLVQRKMIPGIQTLKQRSKIQAAVYTPESPRAGTGAEEQTIKLSESKKKQRSQTTTAPGDGRKINQQNDCVA